MTKEQLEKEIDRLRESSVSKIMIQFLELKVEELDTISGVETIRELQGRKNAIRKLKDIINRFQPQKKPEINEYN